MAVRVLDVTAATAGELARVYALVAVCHAEANAAEPCRPREDVEAFLRHPPASEPRVHRVVEEDGAYVGYAHLGVPAGSASGIVEVLVRPDARRRGLGAQLLAAACDEARARGCREVVGSHAAPAGAAFARAAGAVDTRRDVRSLLRLEDAGLAVPPVPGYELRSWVGAAPEPLLASYAQAREAVNDAPAASGEGWPSWDAARVRDLEATVARRGPELRITVACRDGAVVAFTELRVSRTPGAVATTEDTAVVRGYRRLGVGRAVKAESLRRLRRERPDVRLVATTNAEENTAMLALNRALGFVPAARSTTCALAL